MTGNHYIPNGGWVMILSAYPVAGLGFLLIFLSWTPGALLNELGDGSPSGAAAATGVAGFSFLVLCGLVLLHLSPILLLAGIIRVAVEPIMRQNEVLIRLQTSSQRVARAPAVVRIPEYQAPEPPPMVRAVSKPGK